MPDHVEQRLAQQLDAGERLLWNGPFVNAVYRFRLTGGRSRSRGRQVQPRVSP
jgi:hypothetical protein